MIDTSRMAPMNFFSRFTQDQLGKLSEITAELHFKKGQAVYEAGSPANRIYIVESGRVEMQALSPGETVGIAFEKRGPGDLFGGAALIEAGTYTLAAHCLEPTTVLFQETTDLLTLFEAEPDIGYSLMKGIAHIYFQRYKTAKSQIHKMVFTPPIITALPG